MGVLIDEKDERDSEVPWVVVFGVVDDVDDTVVPVELRESEGRRGSLPGAPLAAGAIRACVSFL